MRGRLLTAVCLVVAGSASAFADPVFASAGGWIISSGGPTGGSGLGTVDGRAAFGAGTFTNVTGTGAGVMTAQLIVQFPSAGIDPTVLIHGIFRSDGAADGPDTLTIDNIRWLVGSGVAATDVANTVYLGYDFADITVGNTNGDADTHDYNSYKILNSGDQSFYVAGAGGAPSWAAINTLIITFTFTQTSGGVGTNQFFIDAVSNPEPGTMALFGLGALGLGGFAWRRRKTRKAAKKA